MSYKEALKWSCIWGGAVFCTAFWAREGTVRNETEEPVNESEEEA